MTHHQPPTVNTGSHGDYQWLVAQYNLSDLLRICPEFALGKYVAITSFDSGPLVPSDEEIAGGWTIRNNITYSPRVQNVDALPRDLYDEWYIFEEAVDLGELAPPDKNVFESSLRKGEVHVFVNFGGFGLHRPETQDLASLFWEQLAWIHPESYVADGDYLTVVTSNNALFAAVSQVLRESAADQ
jgi:hypothetical protein